LAKRPVVSSLTGMTLFRLALIPFSWVYAAVLRLRHALFDLGVLRSRTTSLPSIALGNIALGGTGKTPHVELVLRTLLDPRTPGPLPELATLSRGYGRHGRDLHEVALTDDPRTTGDEPLALKRNFSGVHVFVGADRASAMDRIAERIPAVQAVVLDDALQHRAFRAGLNIALTTWDRPWYKDHVLPAGRLRDIPYRARQADAVIVTKCPAKPDLATQHYWRDRLRLRQGQELFFSGLEHGPLRPCNGRTAEAPTGPGLSALIFTGIADPAPLLAHARTLFGQVHHLRFRDHHAYDQADLQRIARGFHQLATGEKALVTTEKDAARLGVAASSGPLEDLPLAVIGVRAVILDRSHEFQALIRSHVATHPTHR
jgi:tetraacyldisaccharide 4'-kinase